MADVQSLTGSANAPRGKPRAKKSNTRIDFTPMVDLGFLLITFFMLTTNLAKPQIMALIMPDDEGGEREALKQSKVMTCLLGAHDKVYWYEGLDQTKLDSTHFGPQGIRTVILDKMKRVEAQWGLQQYTDLKTRTPRLGSHLNIIIKASDKARYKNLVDILDEMAIMHVRYYVVDTITNAEVALLPPGRG